MEKKVNISLFGTPVGYPYFAFLQYDITKFGARNLPSPKSPLQSPFFWRPKSTFFGKRVTFFSVGIVIHLRK